MYQFYIKEVLLFGFNIKHMFSYPFGHLTNINNTNCAD